MCGVVWCVVVCCVVGVKRPSRMRSDNTHHTHIHPSHQKQIEYGIKRMLGAVDEKVPVITTIRDEQLVPGLVPKGESVLQHDVRTFDVFGWLVVQTYV